MDHPLWPIAREVFARHDLDTSRVLPGGGATNATWLHEEFVLRVAPNAGRADLLREARLAALLPAEVGYPEIVDSGVLHGHEWTLARRLPGHNLEDLWPDLDPWRRARVVDEVWAKAELVHGVDTAAARPHVRPRSPFFPATAEEADARLWRLASGGLLAESRLRGPLHRFWTALPDVPRVLNHGDLGMVNALYDGAHVVSLVDFEFAVLGPVEIDLNEVLKFACVPGDTSGPARDAAIRLARPALARSGGADLLLGYAIMLEAWLLENELATTDDPTELDPYQRLVALTEPDGGYLAPLLTTM